ncbi:MAG: alpha/beta hydrolase [Planctomycetota bacterium]
MAELLPRDAAAWIASGKRVLGVILILLGIFVLFIGCAERSILYPSQHFDPPPPVTLPANARELEVQHDDGRTHAHLYLGQGIDAERPGPVVLYSHGNGEFIEDYFPVGLAGYRAMGVSVLLVEFRGTGLSDGSPTKTTIDADHVAFFDLLAEQPEVDPDRIVLHGRSMGGGIVASLAQQRPGAALVLESTYSSIGDFAASMFIPRFIVKDNWDVSATLATYEQPVFMMHSERDEIIPFAMAQKNRDARPADLPPMTFVTYDVGHNDPMPPQFYEDVEAFFREHGILPLFPEVEAPEALPSDVEPISPSIGLPVSDPSPWPLLPKPRENP